MFIGGSPSEAPALVDLDLNKEAHRVLRRSFVLREDVRRYVSIPQPIAYPTGSGETAHAFYYPPFSLEFAAPADEKAPVLVKTHGGPTSAASSTLSLSTQYWTSRGIGMLDVNYRGSTGYGRPTGCGSKTVGPRRRRGLRRWRALAGGEPERRSPSGS